MGTHGYTRGGERLPVVREYKDSDEKYKNFPEQQKKERSVELRSSSIYPGVYDRVIVERRAYNPDAPHPDNRDW